MLKVKLKMAEFNMAAVLVCIVTCIDLLVASTTPRMNFSAPFGYEESCGLYENEDNWALRGTVEIAKGDWALFQKKMVVQTCTQVCTINLENCADEEPTNGRASCYCRHKSDGVFEVHLGSMARSTQSETSIHALIPSYPSFGPIAAATAIGKLPRIEEKRERIKAYFNVDGGHGKELLPAQTVGVCADNFVTVKVCVNKPETGSVLRLDYNVDGVDSTVLSQSSCVQLSKRYNFESTSTYQLTFSYTKSLGCPHADVSTLTIEGDTNTCERPTTWTTTKTTTTEAPTTTAAPVPWGGACSKSGNTSALEVSTLPNQMEVLCDTETDGGNWVVIQRRTKDDVDFNQSWAQYASGFGNFSTDFWYGLNNIHELCFEKPCQLRSDMRFNGQPYAVDIKHSPDGMYHSTWNIFSVEGPKLWYRLRLEDFDDSRSTAGDDMSQYNKMNFSTADSNHNARSNCGQEKGTGWWWGKSCNNAPPNGLFGSPDGMSWWQLTRYGFPLASIELKVRPSPLV